MRRSRFSPLRRETFPSCSSPLGGTRTALARDAASDCSPGDWFCDDDSGEASAPEPELPILVALKPSGAEAALHGLEDAVGCPVSPASLIDQRAVAGDSDDQPGLWEVGIGLHFRHRAIDDTEAE